MFDFEQFPVYIKAENTYATALKIVSNKDIHKSIKDQMISEDLYNEMYSDLFEIAKMLSGLIKKMLGN